MAPDFEIRFWSSFNQRAAKSKIFRAAKMSADTWRRLTTNPACLRPHTAQADRSRKSCRMTLTRRRYLVTGPMPLAETSLLQGKPMTDFPNKSRQQAEIAFARTQSVSLERANTAAWVDPATQERRDKTLRLKNARLARDSADNEVPAFTRLTDDDETACRS